jgi:hypothetical protein
MNAAACDLSQIDVGYGGEPGRDANMPVCLSLTDAVEKGLEEPSEQ